MRSVAMLKFENVILPPLWLKSPSISMDDLEWAMQSTEQGTTPSWAGERSVVRTRHQSGLSWSRSRTSTVWPRRTDSSPLLPLLATKSWITTVNSQPPESCKGSKKKSELSSFYVKCIATLNNTNKIPSGRHRFSRSIIKMSREACVEPYSRKYSKYLLYIKSISLIVNSHRYEGKKNLCPLKKFSN